ncbi:hypothetical protein AAFF_G00311080 [Aldrovandia affinis]|uniref:Uncharacterized protein n=1 Tax=Aldrovandia affinis TaxID=143900 RepID=A0AAD7RA51_9TELE|nr:hypothetical protein AAFF_G00311080 [Aldrovandia affinis]
MRCVSDTVMCVWVQLCVCGFSVMNLLWLQVHSGAAGGAGAQCVPDGRESAVPRHEGARGERAAGHEAVSVSLPGVPRSEARPGRVVRGA